MDILPSGHFFQELQTIYDTGLIPAHLSLEDKWEQVSGYFYFQNQFLVKLRKIQILMKIADE